MIIDQFKGEYRFLSNFFVEPDGTFVELDFQAGKATNQHDLDWILGATTPAEARKRGGSRAVNIRNDWDSVKVDLMLRLLREKFSDHPVLADKLLATGDCLLVEGNWWHDNFWGSCSCSKCGNREGDNMLGILLYVVRHELRKV